MNQHYIAELYWWYKEYVIKTYIDEMMRYHMQKIVVTHKDAPEPVVVTTPLGVLDAESDLTAYSNLPDAIQDEILRRVTTIFDRLLHIAFKADMIIVREYVNAEMSIYNIIAFNLTMKNNNIPRPLIEELVNESHMVPCVGRDMFCHALAANNYSILFKYPFIKHYFTLDKQVILSYAKLYDRKDAIRFMETTLHSL